MASEGIFPVRWVPFLGKYMPVIMQNANGPCPLLAIANVVSLVGRFPLPPGTTEVDSTELISHVADYLLTYNAPKPGQRRTPEEEASTEATLSELIPLLPKLLDGLDVDPRFTDCKAFVNTRETAAFDAADIRLMHGWVVDPETEPEAAVTLGRLSYNQVLDKIVAALGSPVHATGSAGGAGARPGSLRSPFFSPADGSAGAGAAGASSAASAAQARPLLGLPIGTPLRSAGAAAAGPNGHGAGLPVLDLPAPAGEAAALAAPIVPEAAATEGAGAAADAVTAAASGIALDGVAEVEAAGGSTTALPTIASPVHTGAGAAAGEAEGKEQETTPLRTLEGPGAGASVGLVATASGFSSLLAGARMEAATSVVGLGSPAGSAAGAAGASSGAGAIPVAASAASPPASVRASVSPVEQAEARVMEAWLNTHQSQMTVEGLRQLTDTLRERELAVFFRNNHFSVLFKEQGQLHTLVTDVGYLETDSIVWERFRPDTVTGGTVFVDGLFREPSVTDADYSEQVLLQRALAESTAAGQGQYGGGAGDGGPTYTALPSHAAGEGEGAGGGAGQALRVTRHTVTAAGGAADGGSRSSAAPAGAAAPASFDYTSDAIPDVVPVDMRGDYLLLGPVERANLVAMFTESVAAEAAAARGPGSAAPQPRGAGGVHMPAPSWHQQGGGGGGAGGGAAGPSSAAPTSSHARGQGAAAPAPAPASGPGRNDRYGQQAATLRELAAEREARRWESGTASGTASAAAVRGSSSYDSEEEDRPRGGAGGRGKDNKNCCVQ